MKAWIYFARFGAGGPIKVGRACDPIGRVRGLMIGSPVIISLIGAALSNRAEEEETEIQERLRKHCVRGEWFTPEATLREMEALGERLVTSEGLNNLRKAGHDFGRRDRLLTFRMPQRIRDALEAQAASERRTVADVINNILDERYPAKPREGARRR